MVHYTAGSNNNDSSGLFTLQRRRIQDGSTTTTGILARDAAAQELSSQCESLLGQLAIAGTASTQLYVMQLQVLPQALLEAMVLLEAMA